MVANGRLHIGLTRPVPAHAALGMKTQLLRSERLCAVIPRNHEWFGRRSLSWRALAGHPLIILARREGAGLHDEILAGCRQAGFSPRLIHTPSLISTVLRYVEAGTGVGIVPESITEAEEHPERCRVLLTPPLSVPLVMVWKDGHEESPARVFRELLAGWARRGKLFAPAGELTHLRSGAAAPGRLKGKDE